MGLIRKIKAKRALKADRKRSTDGSSRGKALKDNSQRLSNGQPSKIKAPSISGRLHNDVLKLRSSKGVPKLSTKSGKGGVSSVVKKKILGSKVSEGVHRRNDTKVANRRLESGMPQKSKTSTVNRRLKKLRIATKGRHNMEYTG